MTEAELLLTPPSLETKHFNELVTPEGLNRAFEAFKETNDQRLAELERRGASDVVLTDKLERINQALDRQQRAIDALALKAARPDLSSRYGAATGSEHKAAFEAYVRKGDAGRLLALDQKALSGGVGADGGYTVPPEVEATVTSLMRTVSPIRSIAGIRQVSSLSYKKPFATTTFAAGWVGETAARPQTNTPTLAELSFPTMELYAMPAASQALLDDSAVDIEQWVAEEVRTTFGEQESAAFVTGDGVNKPRGFLNYTTVANASWSWGNLGYLATGVAGGLPATNPTDKLIDLIYSLRSGYRANGTFVLNRSVQGELRKIKDNNGNYIWQPSTAPGTPPLLLGYPVVESEDMPEIAANAFPIAFGDFARGYLIVDRIGIRILRDPYSAKPYVLFYTTKRVGGGVQDFAAIKLLKIAVS